MGIHPVTTTRPLPLPEARRRLTAAALTDGPVGRVGLELEAHVVDLADASRDVAWTTIRAAFNRNVLYVLDRELKADFDPAAFAHDAVWNADAERMEMWLRAEAAQDVRVGALELDVSFAAGEGLRTEVSAKFTRVRVERELAAAGLRLARWWTDAAGDFALSLSVRA